jgi:hypothetical protein
LITEDGDFVPGPADHGWSDWFEAVRLASEETGVLPLVSDSRLPTPSDLELECWQADDDELAALVRLNAAAGAPAQRAATVLLCWFLSLSEPYDADVTDWRQRAQTLLSDALQLLPVDEVENTETLKWELIHAASAGLWDRVAALVRQWVAVSPSDEPKAWAAASRIGFLRAHDFETNWSNQNYWLWYQTAVADFGSNYASLLALHAPSDRDVSAGVWGWPMSITAEQAGVVADIASAAAKARPTIDSLELKAISAWCCAVEGIRNSQSLLTAHAGVDLLAIAHDERVAAPYRQSAARTATVLCRQAHRLDDARAAALLWTELESESSVAWDARAAIERQLGLPWRHSFEEFVKWSADSDKNWQATELLRLALLEDGGARRSQDLDNALLAYRGRDFAASTIAFYWPTYSKLDTRAQERWCSAVMVTNDMELRRTFGDDWSDVVGERFGESVAIELRRRVFAPFVHAGELVVPQLMPDEQRFVGRFRRSGSVTLGEMLELLTATVLPKMPLPRMLAAFLRRTHRPLSNALQNTAGHAQLRRIALRRNEAAHEHMEPDDVSWLHNEAAHFLALLVESDPRRQVTHPGGPVQ